MRVKVIIGAACLAVCAIVGAIVGAIGTVSAQPDRTGCERVAADLGGTLVSCRTASARSVNTAREAQGRKLGSPFTDVPENARVARGEHVTVAVVRSGDLPGPGTDRIGPGFVRLISQPDGTWVPDTISTTDPGDLS